MKYTRLKYLIVGGLLTALTACDEGFIETNTNPVEVTSIDPSFTFANAQRLSVVPVYIFENEIVQQVHSPFTGTPSGGNLNVENDSHSSNTWEDLYSGPVKLLADVIDKTKDIPEQSNLYNMARIWRAYVFQVLVDTYGDVPYSEAGLAYLGDINLPKYDEASIIYDDIIKEYTEATAALDPSQPIFENDLFYNGEISKWKKLGNSLLLRAYMRYSKSNPTKAEQGVKAAVNADGGFISSNDDNARILFSDAYTNPWVTFLHNERSNMYLGAPFVDFLKSTNDPRLEVIAVKYEFPSSHIGSTGSENTDPESQQGMPYGYNDANIDTAPGYPGKIGTAWKYSQVNRGTIGKVSAPAFFVTFSQTQLLLAEAAFRGWIEGDAANLYNEGVKAHMEQMELYDEAAEISIAEQETYLSNHPFDPARALEQINTQYWVSSFLNGHEAWANFRRSGYPDLIPNPYPAADPAVQGGFIRKLPYPSREEAVNPANLAEAVDRMGSDNLGTRIFWDQ